MKTAKKKLIKVFGSWVIDNNQPFMVLDSIHTSPLLDIIREIAGMLMLRVLMNSHKYIYKRLVRR